MKLSGDELQKLLNCIKKNEQVVIPPMIGYDAGVHLLDGKYVVVATDPCTGVPMDWFGWLLINYAASDVALFGAKPAFCTITLLGPRPSNPEFFQMIMQQTCKAADELEIAVVRGHTGMYDSLKDLVGVCTVYGTVEPEGLITPGYAKDGDLILCTKPVGLETLSIFSITHPSVATELFGTKQQELTQQVSMQSCVKEALSLSKINGVHAMHDATEGGVLTALNELADASHVGFRVNWNDFPISKEVFALQKHFGLSDEQVLALSSTGTILAAVAPQVKQQVIDVLSLLGLPAYFLGTFTFDKCRLLTKAGKETLFPASAVDPYTQLMASRD
ncbi:MAG: AIR synthase-related protein [Candidatus Bathyarchaeota archaeon]|nr:AIR synthase-related protein [Candidatus Bathyarchaeota archaeon]